MYGGLQENARGNASCHPLPFTKHRVQTPTTRQKAVGALGNQTHLTGCVTTSQTPRACSDVGGAGALLSDIADEQH